MHTPLPRVMRAMWGRTVTGPAPFLAVQRSTGARSCAELPRDDERAGRRPRGQPELGSLVSRSGTERVELRSGFGREPELEGAAALPLLHKAHLDQLEEVLAGGLVRQLPRARVVPQIEASLRVT